MQKENKDELIIKDLINGLTYKEICIKYKCGHRKITKLAIKNSIVTKNMIKSRKIVTSNPFLDLNNKNVQYWLGFLAADGSIFKTRISLHLQEKDESHIDKYIQFIGFNVTKHKTIKNNKYIGYGVHFKSKEITEFLYNLGITNKKSYTLDYKGIITTDFLRGVIDGDGYIRKNHNEVSICTASLLFAKQLQSFIINTFNINCSLRESKPNFYTIGVYGKNQVNKILKELYNNAEVYLNRKFLNASLNGNIEATIP